MKTSSRFHAGMRGGLFLLACVLPLSASLASDRKRSSRTVRERPVLVSNSPVVLYKAARQLERSMIPPQAVRPSAVNARSSRPASRPAGLPQKVVLTPRRSSHGTSTIIYTAPQPLTTAELGQHTYPAEEGYQSNNTLLEPPVEPTVKITPPAATTSAAKPLPPLDKGKLPVAQRSETMNRVISPYPPHRELDVAGLPSRSLARDPSSGKIFVVP